MGHGGTQSYEAKEKLMCEGIRKRAMVGPNYEARFFGLNRARFGSNSRQEIGSNSGQILGKKSSQNSGSNSGHNSILNEDIILVRT